MQQQQNDSVSPYAGAIVRFTKPVDLETVKWADTFFFAMRDLTTDDSIADFIANRPFNNGGVTGVGMNPAPFDLASPPVAGATILSGSTWSFQLVFRDLPGGGAGFNFSDGLELTFL